MKPAAIRCLILFVFSILSLASVSGSCSEYGDAIKDTPEYKKITEPKADDDKNDDHDHHYYYHDHDPFYRPPYPPPPAYYERSPPSRGSGLSGIVSLGITIGDSEFDYDDIDDGDASRFHVGYQPENSRMGYEVSFFSSGEAEVTSLTGIEIEVDTINLALTFNSSKNNISTLNFFGQGGIYFADTTLSGPADSVSEKSNGFLLAVGVDIMLNRHFGLRVEAFNFFNVEDFVDDKSVSFFGLGGKFVF